MLRQEFLNFVFVETQLKSIITEGVAAHALNLSTQEAEGGKFQ